jgi:hypothetical protein
MNPINNTPPPKGILWDVLKYLDSDFEPYGKRSRKDDFGPDCSCGCKFFVPLEGKLGYDWGVCANTESARAGLLTWEHMGCKQFVAAPEEVSSQRESV